MKTVAVIGASADRMKYGNKAVRAYKQQGYQVFPVNQGQTRLTMRKLLRRSPQVRNLLAALAASSVLLLGSGADFAVRRKIVAL